MGLRSSVKSISWRMGTRERFKFCLDRRPNENCELRRWCETRGRRGGASVGGTPLRTFHPKLAVFPPVALLVGFAACPIHTMARREPRFTIMGNHYAYESLNFLSKKCAFDKPKQCWLQPFFVSPFSMRVRLHTFLLKKTRLRIKVDCGLTSLCSRFYEMISFAVSRKFIESLKTRFCIWTGRKETNFWCLIKEGGSTHDQK